MREGLFSSYLSLSILFALFKHCVFDLFIGLFDLARNKQRVEIMKASEIKSVNGELKKISIKIFENAKIKQQIGVRRDFT